jgi:hypothetical protein
MQQPQNPSTIAERIDQHLRQMTQSKPTLQPQAQGLPQLSQQPAEQPAQQPVAQNMPQAPTQGIDQLPANVGQSYANGGIIGFSEGGYPEERDTLRRIEAATYDQTHPVTAPQTSDDIIKQAMLVDAAEKRREAENRRGAITRDTASLDELRQELKSQRDRLNGPQDWWGKLMEQVEQTANAPKGMGNLSAGAFGVQKQKELNLARQAQQHELTKQELDLAQKKADIGYQQKMDVFNAGESAEAAAIKAKYEAAINREANTLKKAELAQQMELELQKLAVHKQQVNAMRINPLLQISNAIGAAKTPEEAQRIKDLFAAQYGDKAAYQGAQVQQLIGNDFADIDKAYKEDPRRIGGLPNAPKESYAKFVEMQREIEDKKEAVLKRYIPGAGKGLPDLNKANPGSSTAAPGQPDYSKLWK